MISTKEPIKPVEPQRHKIENSSSTNSHFDSDTFFSLNNFQEQIEYLEQCVLEFKTKFKDYEIVSYKLNSLWNEEAYGECELVITYWESIPNYYLRLDKYKQNLIKYEKELAIYTEAKYNLYLQLKEEFEDMVNESL